MAKSKAASASSHDASLSSRDKILQAAFIEFGDNGFAAARMDKISAASGVSKQLLYHHFSSKEGLFEATLREAYATLRQADDQLKKSVDALEPDAALDLFIEHLFRPSVDRERFQQLVYDENKFAGIHAAKLGEAQAAYAQLIEIMSHILARGAAEGVFRADLDPVQFYISLAGALIFRTTHAHTLSIMYDVDLISEEGAARSRAYAMDLIREGMRPGSQTRRGGPNPEMGRVSARRDEAE